MVCAPCLGFAFLVRVFILCTAEPHAIAILKVSLLLKTMPIYDSPDEEPGAPGTTKNSTEA
jgi:hypothetical protein